MKAAVRKKSLLYRRMLKAMTAAFEEALHPRDKDGKFTDSGNDALREAYQFYSPNRENLTFDQAMDQLSSYRQVWLKNIGKDIDSQIDGWQAHPVDAIGDWSDGAENTVFNVIEGAKNYDDVRYSAAIKGSLAEQKAVIPFLVDPNGKDSIYRFTLPGDLATARSELDQQGIQFRTLIPGKGSQNVVVFDPGSEMLDKMKKIGDDYDITIKHYPGRGEFLGSWDTREEGEQVYQHVIKAYDAAHPDHHYTGPSLPNTGDAERKAVAAGGPGSGRRKELFNPGDVRHEQYVSAMLKSLNEGAKAHQQRYGQLAKSRAFGQKLTPTMVRSLNDSKLKAAFDPSEARDNTGKWTDSGQPEQKPNTEGMREYPMSPEQKALEDRSFAYVRSHLAEAEAQYRQKFGNVINTDSARMMFPEYVKDKAGNAMGVLRPAQWLVSQIFDEDIAKHDPSKNPDVVFTAGGPGVGKSTSIAHNQEVQDLMKSAQVVVDSTGTGIGPKIQKALENGDDAHVVYIYRDPQEAFVHGVLPRAMDPDDGRPVRIDEAADVDVRSRAAIEALAKKYKDNPHVHISFIDNSHGWGNAKQVGFSDLPKAETDKQKLTDQFRDILEQEYRAGHVSDKIYKASLPLSTVAAAGDDTVSLGKERLEQALAKDSALGVRLAQAAELWKQEVALNAERQPVSGRIARYWGGGQLDPQDVAELDGYVRQEGQLWAQRRRANIEASEALIAAVGTGKVHPLNMLFDAAMSEGHQHKVRRCAEVFEQLLGADPSHGAELKITGVKGKEVGLHFSRSFYEDKDNSIHFWRATCAKVWHELGHWLERQTPGGDAAAKAYLDSRTSGEPEKKLRELDDGKPGYDPDEVAQPDKFIEPYIGKRYESGTELTSMGMQLLREDIGKLWAEDRELLEFVLGMVCMARGTQVEA